MRWITRRNIKVDRVAFLWLIRRFIDREAEFIFVPEKNLLTGAVRHFAFLLAGGQSKVFREG